MYIQNDDSTKTEYKNINNEVEDKNTKKQNTELSSDEQRKVEELKKIDNKVRAHERAHLNNAQGLSISGAQFEYEKGPDGKNYAVAGEVKIDVSKESEPEKTIQKSKKIVRAALAPQDPSAQDRKVAALGRQMENEAKLELMRQRLDENQDTKKDENIKETGNQAGSYGSGPSTVDPLVDLYG